jgi:hypothetical protein
MTLRMLMISHFEIVARSLSLPLASTIGFRSPFGVMTYKTAQHEWKLNTEIGNVQVAAAVRR